MKYIYIFIIAIFCQGALYSKVIELDFPKNANKMVTLSLKQGTSLDTLYHAPLNADGKATIMPILPNNEYRGMASLSFENGTGVDFILTSTESPIIICNEEYPNGENVIFHNSRENEALQRWFVSQAIREQQIGLVKESLNLYKEQTSFYPHLLTEEQKLISEQKSFEDAISKSPLYAARFMEFYNYLLTDIVTLVYADSLQMAQTRAFVRDSLDVENLLNSGLWFDTLNGLLAIYDNNAPYHKEFINDMAYLLKQSKYDTTYATFAENLFAICEAMGWNDLEEQLAYFLINDGRIVNPTGRLEILMNLLKLGKGSKIPKLTQGELPKGKLVIVFYETGCNSCENEMLALQANYSTLKEKGYEVVSIAADTDKDIFENTANNFPWLYKYCDLKGFQGDDFRNFGVIGTPTFYVVDENQTLQGRYARLVDTGLLL